MIAGLRRLFALQTRPNGNVAMARVLVIDDDAEMRSMLRQLLDEQGHDVIEARDGKRGSELYATHAIDVVITDIFMPDKDGLETIVDLRKQFPDAKIIAISGQLSRHNMLPVATALGACRTIAKPFQPQELIEAVWEVLSRD